jgi:sulfide dehydrogenase cytochrome subunit
MALFLNNWLFGRLNMTTHLRFATFAASLAAAGCLAFAASPAHAADLKTATTAANCAVCHGPGGQTAGHTPRLSGMTAEKIREALGQFASGDKPATIMDRISKGFSAEEIKAIAEHIAMMNNK